MLLGAGGGEGHVEVRPGQERQAADRQGADADAGGEDVIARSEVRPAATTTALFAVPVPDRRRLDGDHAAGGGVVAVQLEHAAADDRAGGVRVHASQHHGAGAGDRQRRRRRGSHAGPGSTWALLP